MKERKMHYSIDELIEIVEDPGNDANVGMIMDSIIYAIKDLQESVESLSESVESLDNESRGYDP